MPHATFFSMKNASPLAFAISTPTHGRGIDALEWEGVVRVIKNVFCGGAVLDRCVYLCVWG